MEGNQLSTFRGCFVPCLLTILGAVLFLRLGFAVGMMGLAGAMALLVVSELMSCITVTSFSALVSNGNMRGGGAYYVISRSLGPAFGGAGGLLFWASWSMNAAFNVVAITDVLQANLVPADSWWAGRWASLAISSMTLLPPALLAYKGAGAFARANDVVLVGLSVACLATMGSLFLRIDELQLAGGPGRMYRPFNLETLADNLWPDPVVSEQCESSAAFGMGKRKDQVCSARLIFSVIFPAVVGMTQGLNLSGDLKRPAHSIPVGTFWAVGTAFVVYAAFMVGQAGTLSREALQYNMDVLEQSTVGGGYFVILGVVLACLSTVLGSILGAARVLQALARDDTFPGLSCFKYGTARGDEPQPAILASYLLAQASLSLGNLDDLAPLLTNFFLLTYALTDMACFLLEISRVPNFRPTFRFYSWQTSLANSALLVLVMFYLSPVYAGVTCLATLLIFAWLTRRFRDRPEWIDVSQALLFRWARHSLIAMQRKPQDTKYWRPSLLLLVPSSADSSTLGFLPLVSFLDMLKQSGLLVIGRALISEQPPESSPLELEHRSPTGDGAQALPNFNGFQQWAVAPSGRLASYNLILGAGLGRLLPDTLVLPLPSIPIQGGLPGTPADGSSTSQQACLEPPVSGAWELVQVIRDALSLRRNVLVTANFHEMWDGRAKLPAPQVDMWVFGKLHEPPLPAGAAPGAARGTVASSDTVNQMSLMLQLGHLVAVQSAAGHGAPNLRLLQAECRSSTGDAPDTEASEATLSRWLRWSRVPRASAGAALLEVPPRPAAPGADPPPRGDRPDPALLRGVIGLQSANAAVVFTLLPPPPPPSDDSEFEYVRSLCDMTQGLPPLVLALSGQGVPVISTEV